MKLKYVFDVLGSKEPALTRVLAILIKKDKIILRKIFKDSRLTTLKGDYAVSFEEHLKGVGRVDVIIESTPDQNQWKGIIEAKICQNELLQEQAEKYCEYLKQSLAGHKFLILLTENGVPQQLLKPLKKKFPSVKIGEIKWGHILEILEKRKKRAGIQPQEKWLLNELVLFINGGLSMKTSNMDIWAVPIKIESEINRLRKCRVYVNDHSNSPIFIAPRLGGPKISELYPVINVHPPGSGFAKPHNQGRKKPCYIYELGEPIQLAVSVKKNWGMGDCKISFVKFVELQKKNDLTLL
jgi:hypothetical protein